MPAPSLQECEASIDEWLAGSPLVTAVEAIDRGEPSEPGRGDTCLAREEHITLWFTLGQRTLRFEVYVLPAPQENAQPSTNWRCRNDKLVGAHFAIGVEDAIFLRRLPLTSYQATRSHHAYVEQSFPAMIRLAFASKFQ